MRSGSERFFAFTSTEPVKENEHFAIEDIRPLQRRKMTDFRQ